MKVRIRKPKEGVTTIVLDDSRGATGRRRTLENVPVEEVAESLLPELALWETGRKAIKDARKSARA